jgi:hypothetical protein
MQDFAQHFREQMDFLRLSADAYDAGVEHEAKRLAGTIRNLVWDKGQNRSLLTHLGVKDKLGFVDTAPPDPPPPPVVVLSFGLAVAEMLLVPGAATRYVPAFTVPDDQRTSPATSFVDWWTLPVLRDQQGHEFSREDLVLGLAHKDGGVHIDRTITGAYAALTRENSLGFGQGDGRPMANSVVHVSVRQIAWELERTCAGLDWEDGDALVPSPVCPLPYSAKAAGGRNDLCPCGSGKKLKYCFGERRPRLRMRTPSDAEEMTPQTPEGEQIPGTAISREPPDDGPPRLHLDCMILVPVDNRRAA